MIKNAVNIPWPIIGVVLFWGIYGLVYFADRQAFIAMVKKCSAEKFNNSELITNFTKFFKFHPLSPHKTDLIVKMIPSLVAEKRPIINWVRKINGKDIDVQFPDALLFSYFVLQEKGYINELNLLKNKTDKCFSDDSEFHKIKNCIFHSELINVDEIDALNGTYSKGIAYFYTALNSYMLGNIEFGNIYAEKAVSLIPEKTMSDLVFGIRSSHEEAN